ncbi:glycosyltransferase [Williamsia soli]|uniref:glycosyltransferase n=1 Tax=Williamsia soli TaxID=364929 RepID=UPI001A9FF861|nr:glycosyltransferase [Williamsia soli]
MPKVAIIGSRGYPSYYGGFETLIRHLAPYLADEGWDAVVYSRRGATVEEEASGRRDKGSIVSILTPGIESRSISTLSYGLSSVLHAAFKRPDVALVLNVANGFWLPILKLSRVPTVVNVDGIEWEREKWGRLAKAVFKFGARFTARFADVIVSDSEEIAARWRRDFGRESEFLPYGGTVSADNDPVPGLAPGTYILYVARFVPENSTETFFDAVSILAERRQVVIVGSTGYGGELDDRAAALSASHDNVEWLGHLRDDKKLFALWSNAGAYFHGHSVGGTNPALVQAMACGAPTVARDTVYNREVLGDGGAVFTAPDPQEIARALDALMEDPNLRQRLTMAVRDRQSEAYTWEGVCSGYASVLRSAIRQRRG